MPVRRVGHPARFQARICRRARGGAVSVRLRLATTVARCPSSVCKQPRGPLGPSTDPDGSSTRQTRPSKGCRLRGLCALGARFRHKPSRAGCAEQVPARGTRCFARSRVPFAVRPNRRRRTGKLVRQPFLIRRTRLVFAGKPVWDCCQFQSKGGPGKVCQDHELVKGRWRGRARTGASPPFKSCCVCSRAGAELVTRFPTPLPAAEMPTHSAHLKHDPKVGPASLRSRLSCRHLFDRSRPCCGGARNVPVATDVSSYFSGAPARRKVHLRIVRVIRATWSPGYPESIF